MPRFPALTMPPRRPVFDPLRHITRTAAARHAGVVPRTLHRWETTKGLTPIRFNARLVGYDKTQLELIVQDYRASLPAGENVEAFAP